MPKQSALVCEYVENIGREALKKYQRVIRQRVRRRHGIYALHRKNKLYYVGLATNLHVRLKQHLEDHHAQSWDRFSVYLTIGDRHLRELESLILRITKPAGNRVKGKFAKAENLRRHLTRNIKLLQRAELNGIIGRVLPTQVVIERPSKNGRVPVLQSYVTKPIKLLAIYKHKKYRASVRRDGSIRHNGSIYTSPTQAAIAVVNRPRDGWYFWKYERAPGDWVQLNELRR